MRGGFRSRLTTAHEENYSISQLDKNALRLLYSYLKDHSTTLILALIAMITVTLTTLAGPYLTKIAIDNYIITGNLTGLNIICIFMLLSYGLFWFSSYWQTYLSSKVGQTIVATIRKDLYKHLQMLPMEFYSKRLTGEIMSRLTHDVNVLSDLVSNGCIHLLNDLLTVIGITIILLHLNIKLALISLITMPLIFLVIFFLGKQMRNAYKEVREKLATLNADVEENISGIRLVQALNRENVNLGKFQISSWENLTANLKAVSYFALLFPVMTLSRVLGEALVLTFGGFEVVSGAISIGVLVAFLSYIRRFFAPLADLSQVYNTYQTAAAGLDRIYEYLTVKPTIEETANPVPIKVNEVAGEINFKQVVFAYEQTPIINNLNLTIEPGTTLALVGTTGAGKTTLIKLLCRLYEIQQGSILIDNNDIRKMSLKTLREIISVVPQNVFLFNTSIKENIRYGKLDATDEEIESVAKEIGAHNFIKELPKGYDTEVGESGVRLSGGQRQLISFARTLLVNPKILVLDEATSSVDAYTEVIIQKALEKLVTNRTTIIIAHRFTTLKLANKIAILQNGKIVAEGTHDELMQTNSLYQDLCSKQFDGVA